MGWRRDDRSVVRATEYPITPPADPLYPCQATDLLGEPLEGVATPALWSCLCAPLERSQRELWRALGLSQRNLPERLVALHWGRIALNAHAWERLRSRLLGVSPDTSLVRPAAGPLEALAARVECARARVRRGRLERALAQTREAAALALDRAAKVDPSESDLQDLARGALDEQGWISVLLPWIVERLKREGAATGLLCSRLSAALHLEQSHAAELGRRLVERGALESAGDVVYLMREEGMRAAHGDASLVSACIEQRRERVARFLNVELPARFWGRPRVELRQKS